MRSLRHLESQRPCGCMWLALAWSPVSCLVLPSHQGRSLSAAPLAAPTLAHKTTRTPDRNPATIAARHSVVRMNEDQASADARLKARARKEAAKIMADATADRHSLSREPDSVWHALYYYLLLWPPKSRMQRTDRHLHSHSLCYRCHRSSEIWECLSSLGAMTGTMRPKVGPRWVSRMKPTLRPRIHRLDPKRKLRAAHVLGLRWTSRRGVTRGIHVLGLR